MHGRYRETLWCVAARRLRQIRAAQQEVAMRIFNFRRLLGLLAIGGAIAYARKKRGERRGIEHDVGRSPGEAVTREAVTHGVGTTVRDEIAGGGIEADPGRTGGGGFADTPGIPRR
jgi:hypothetical protein